MILLNNMLQSSSSMGNIKSFLPQQLIDFDLETQKINTGSNFANLLQKVMVDTYNAVKKSEEIGAEAIIGKASMSDVVTAVSEADVALQSMILIRDKAIASYNDIIRMQI